MEDRNSVHPLFIPNVLEEVCNFLPFQDLKIARLVNHLWHRAATPAWTRKTKITFSTFLTFRNWMARTLTVKKVLPYSTDTWVFQGETLMVLWTDEGEHERYLMEQFWPLIRNLELSNWLAKRYRRVGRFKRQHRYVPYYSLTKIGSSHTVKEMLKMCTNLTQLVIDFAPLTTMKGKNIGPRQFPQLEKLTHLKIFYKASKWSNVGSAIQRELLEQNLRRAEPEQQLPPNVSGGNTLIMRLLDHSPRLTTIIVTSGTSMSSRMETWFTQRHLLAPTANLHSLVEYRCWILLQQDICLQLQALPWGLRSLHLKTHPGTSVSPALLHNTIACFRETLQHLELIFIGEPAEGEHSGHLFNGYQLHNLEILEMWGYKGDYTFIMDLRKLRKAVIGVTHAGYLTTLRRTFRNILIPNVDLELKTVAAFRLRLNEGPHSS